MNLRKLSFAIITLIISAFIVLNFTGCKEDDPDPIKDLVLSNLTTNDNVDLLNTAVQDVPMDASFIATFSANLDVTTVTTSSITLTDGSEQVELALNAVGSKITITPKENLKNGRSYELKLTNKLKSFEGGSFAEKSISFKVVGTQNVDPLTVESIKAGSADLNGTTAATDISIQTDVIIVFSSDVDESTVNSTSVALSTDGNDVASNIQTANNTITISPNADLLEQTEYTLTLANTLKSSDGGLFDVHTITFTTGSAPVTPPQSDHQVAFWRFNGNTNDYIGNQTTVIEQLSYDEDRHGNANAAGSFNGEGDILEIAANENLLSKNITISFWVKMDTADYQETRYLLGLGVENGYYFEILSHFENISFTTRNDNGDGTADVQWGEESAIPKPIPDNIWAHVVISMGDDGIRKVYFNGAIIAEYDLGTKGIEYDDTIDGINANLAFGYVCSTTSTGTDWAIYEDDKTSTYKGLLDDIRIFDIVLTDAEVQTLYDAEK